MVKHCQVPDSTWMMRTSASAHLDHSLSVEASNRTMVYKEAVAEDAARAEELARLGAAAVSPTASDGR